MQTGSDLKNALFQGLINEDVMQTITNLSENIDTPLSDMIPTGSHGNAYCSWTQWTHADPNPTNAQVDGRDSVDDDTTEGIRVGNHSQISTKDIAVSTRADESDTIGFQKATTHQIKLRSEDLRRDIEAAMAFNNASQEDDGNTVPGIAASLQAWIATNVEGTGTPGGWQGDGTVNAYTLGAPRALTETHIRNMAQAVYEQGGMPSVFMAKPQVIRGVSEYMFTSSSRIATLTKEAPENSAAKAIMSVNVMVMDFGVVMKMIPNRVQVNPDVATTDANSTAFILDPSMLQLSYLHGLRAERLAKTGLSEKWLMSADWTLKVMDEAGLAMIADIDATAAVTA